MQLRVEGGKATLRPARASTGRRSSRRSPRPAPSCRDGIIDGEVVRAGPQRRARLRRPCRRRCRTARPRTWSSSSSTCCSPSGEDLRALPLTRPQGAAAGAARGRAAANRLRYVDHFVTAGDAVLQSACRMDLEGIVSKRLDAPYRSGRSESWTKSKCRAGHEVVIGGWTDDAAAAFRSLIAGRQPRRRAGPRRPGRHRLRRATRSSRVLPKLKALETDKSARSPAPARRARRPNVHWAKPELVAEIEFAGFTGDGTIRQAALQGPARGQAGRRGRGRDAGAAATHRAGRAGADDGPRQDRHGREAPSGAWASPSPTPTRRCGRTPATASRSPSWSWRATTRRSASWMLPHIKGRPCSMIRMPDGIDGEQHFFQRHAGKGSSALITEVEGAAATASPTSSSTGSRRWSPPPRPARSSSTPGTASPVEPETPGRLVFDLDPAPDVAFERGDRGRARRCKARLEALGLVSLLQDHRRQGPARGHAAARRKGIDWPTAKAFARDVCERDGRRRARPLPDQHGQEAERTGPDLPRLPAQRPAWRRRWRRCRRARRPGAPVSFPLTWTQVKTGLDPQSTPSAPRPALLKKTKAWEDYCDAERPLAPAIKKLK